MLKRKVEYFYLRVMTFLFVFISTVILPKSGFAADSGGLKDFIEKTAKIIKYASYTLGVGLGILFVVAGFAKIRRKGDDVREFQSGIWMIVAGIGMGLAGMIFSWALDYYGISSTSSGYTVDISAE